MSERGSADAVEEFLELEAELSSGTKRAETYEQGNIAGVAKIPNEEVPDDYPVPIRTREALHLDVETPDGETVATYLEWPGEGEQSDHVERLLDALGRGRDEFANVYGDRVALDAVDGWHGIDPERTAALRNANRTSSSDAPTLTRNLLAGVVGAGALGLALSDVWEGTIGLLMIAWFAIPALVYVDANRVEEATSWSPKRNRWVAGTLAPIFNVPVGLAYLVARHVGLSGIAPGETSGVWHKCVIGATLAIPLAFVLTNALTSLGAMLFFYGYLFLPFAIYFDAAYVADATDWDPNRNGWVVGALVLTLFAGIGYLVKRHEATN